MQLFLLTRMIGAFMMKYFKISSNGTSLLGKVKLMTKINDRKNEISL
jgi:hypothetical protein